VPVENRCRPAADLSFASVRKVVGLTWNGNPTEALQSHPLVGRPRTGINRVGVATWILFSVILHSRFNELKRLGRRIRTAASIWPASDLIPLSIGLPESERLYGLVMSAKHFQFRNDPFRSKPIRPWTLDRRQMTQLDRQAKGGLPSRARPKARITEITA